MGQVHLLFLLLISKFSDRFYWNNGEVGMFCLLIHNPNWISKIYMICTRTKKNRNNEKWGEVYPVMTTCSFMEKAPYRIWTDDLRLTMALLYHWVKRARFIQFRRNPLAAMSLLHDLCIYYTYLYTYIHRDLLRNNKFDLPFTYTYKILWK